MNLGTVRRNGLEGTPVSIALILMLLGIIAGFVAFAPGILGERWVEGFGRGVNRWADGARHSLAKFGQAVVGALLLIVVFIFIGLIASFSENNGPPPGASEKVENEYVGILLTVLKYTGFFVGGLIGLAMAVAVTTLLLWLAARLLAVIPVTPRSIAIIAFACTVAICVAGYMTAP
jgi:hypothetical protein